MNVSLDYVKRLVVGGPMHGTVVLAHKHADCYLAPVPSSAITLYSSPSAYPELRDTYLYRLRYVPLSDDKCVLVFAGPNTTAEVLMDAMAKAAGLKVEEGFV